MIIRNEWYISILKKNITLSCIGLKKEEFYFVLIQSMKRLNLWPTCVDLRQMFGAIYFTFWGSKWVLKLPYSLGSTFLVPVMYCVLCTMQYSVYSVTTKLQQSEFLNWRSRSQIWRRISQHYCPISNMWIYLLGTW